MLKIIADAGSNHNGDMNRILALIETAKRIGCDAVKFQYFRADKLYAEGFESNRADVKRKELSDKFVPAIRTLCDVTDIEFHVTPFHSEHVAFLASEAHELKVASYSLLDMKLIRACAESGLPTSISVGGGSTNETQNAIDAFQRKSMQRLTVYHCLPEYPAQLCPGNMELISNLKREDVTVGYSDHTRKLLAMQAAVAKGADALEFHLDIDGTGWEYGHGHCWLPNEAQTMIKSCRELHEMLYPSGPTAVLSYAEMRKWRNDPEDEARPVREYRDEIIP